MFAVAWLLGGGGAGVAVQLIALWFEGVPIIGSVLRPSLFAASIFGGFMSILWSVAGGMLVGLAEVLGTRFLAGEIGPWLIAYRPLIPLALIVATLFLAPRGLAGIRWRRNGGGR